jgi:hypothetical protein
MPKYGEKVSVTISYAEHRHIQGRRDRFEIDACRSWHGKVSLWFAFYQRCRNVAFMHAQWSEDELGDKVKRPWRSIRCWIEDNVTKTYECVSKCFRTGRLERELQMVQLSVPRCSCIAILWVSLVSFAAITLSVAFQLVFNIVVFYFVMTQSGNVWIQPRKAMHS